MDVCTSSSSPPTDYFPPPPPTRKPSVWRKRLLEDRTQLPRFWPVIQNFVIQELRVRYQRSVLGFFWTLLNPLLMLFTLSWAFSRFVGAGPDYSRYLFSGMVPWIFMSGTISECTLCIIANEGLIRKIYVPKLVFPLSRLLTNLVTFLLTLVALFLIFVPMGEARICFPLLLLPLPILLYAMFTLGLSLAVATINTFYRDCGHLVSVFLQAWYFASPILYQTDRFPPEARWRFRLNPAYYFLDLFHAIIYDGRWPDGASFLLSCAIAVASLGIGYAIFKSQEDKMVFRL
jgi:ABC-2 type transport system permease protein/lipopolysaccharide transport system permease protein